MKTLFKLAFLFAIMQIGFVAWRAGLIPKAVFTTIFISTAVATMFVWEIFVLDLRRGIRPPLSMAYESMLMRNGKPFEHGEDVDRIVTVNGFGFVRYVSKDAGGEFIFERRVFPLIWRRMGKDELWERAGKQFAYRVRRRYALGVFRLIPHGQHRRI